MYILLDITNGVHEKIAKNHFWKGKNVKIDIFDQIWWQKRALLQRFIGLRNTSKWSLKYALSDNTRRYLCNELVTEVWEFQWKKPCFSKKSFEPLIHCIMTKTGTAIQIKGLFGMPGAFPIQWCLPHVSARLWSWMRATNVKKIRGSAKNAKKAEVPTLTPCISTRKGRIWKNFSCLFLEWPQESIRVKKVGGQKIVGSAQFSTGTKSRS